MSVKFSIASDETLIHRKILINKMSLESLKLQIKFSKSSIKLQNNSIEVATKKLPLVQELINLCENQLSKPSQENLDAIQEVCNAINQLDIYTPEQRKVLTDLKNYENELCNLIEKIKYLENLVPEKEEIDVYTYTVGTKPEEPIKVLGDIDDDETERPDNL